MRTRLTYIDTDGIKVIDCIERPPENVQRIIDEALVKFPVHNVEFFFSPIDEWPPEFAGLACRTNDNMYAVCISGYKFQHYEKYIKWVINHELRHCRPDEKTINFYLKGLQFRNHDVLLMDVGHDPPRKIGFFWEDFDEIKCCDYLMYLFQNVEGIEEHLT